MSTTDHACSLSHAAHPTSEHPIDSLVADHEVILAVLEALEKQATAVRGGAAFLQQSWARFPEFVRNFADKCHHGKEEELLFPALIAHGLPDPGGPVTVMKHEHVLGRELTARLARAIEAGDAQGACSAAFEYVGLLREHIAKENGVLFPLGKRVLADRAVAELRRGFARVEQEVMGEGTHCKYVDLAMQICAEAGVSFETRRGESLGGGCCGHG
jgi:hemerythrin-like domain-containing protein